MSFQAGARGVAVLLLALACPALAAGPDVRAAALVPQQSVAPDVVERVLARTVPAERPFQFAVPVALDWSLADGAWSQEGDTAVWRLRLHSGAAQSLSVHLAPLRLPEGAGLWLYDPQGRLLHGPFSSAPGGLWTPIVLGPELVLEVRTPAATAGAVELGIPTVFHGFRGWRDHDTHGKSGGCNIDVACAQGNAWRDPIRSVARITVNGQFLCSGQLVNNVRQDETPYFLTADHCGVGDAANDRGPASSVVFYWNYQTSSCGGTPDGSLSQAQSGSQFVADDVGSDFTLLRLDSAPSSQFNVHYAGWNAAPQAPQSGAGIHHPAGDEKRISLYDSPAQPMQGQFPGSNALINGWQVRWSQGVTEQGSSGSGLWDQNRHVVGVLSYGNTSCENPNGTDVYGRLDAAWTASPDPAGQLKAHLDPDNTGVTFLDGRGGVTPPNANSDVAAPTSYNVGAWPLLALLPLLLGAILRRRARG